MDEPIFSCEICNKGFNSKEALEMHNKAKHSEAVERQKEIKPASINFKKIRNWGIFIVILGLISWGIYAMLSTAGSYDNLPASQMNIGGHQNIALHIHSGLTIKINGTEQEIPVNIGILPGIMRPLHTHDGTGEIHIEGPYKRDFTLGEFFEIWGETLNATCIFEYCTNIGSNSTLKMLVNEQESQQFENYVLREDDRILVEFYSAQ